MFRINNKSILVFGDGIPYEDLSNIDKNILDGLTYNPTLFKNIGVKNYLEYAKNIVSKVSDLSISLEVIADDNKNSIEQSKKLSKLGKNVSIKIPITFTNGELTIDTITSLTKKNINMNITAIFTLDQIKSILPIIKNTKTILSVFAGRLYDIGIDAKKELKIITNYVHNNSNCKVLWASPRMSFDIISAVETNCDIITMPNSLIDKLKIIGTNPD
ncbi:transaldolase, partial [Alphaproteobacteria bacterium]|nr:transaldolase [Alphaproteobacteria bacterium]